MAKGKGGSGRTINVFHVIFDRKSCHVYKLLQSSSKVLGPKIHLNQLIRYNSMPDKRQRWPFLVLHFQNKPRTQSGNRVFNVNALDESSKPKLFLLLSYTCSGLMCLAPIAIHSWGFFIWKNVFISANRSLASCGWYDENSLGPWSPSFSWGESELAKCGHSPQVLFLRSQLKIAYGKLTRENVGGLGHQDCVTCIMWSVNVGKSIWYDRLCSCESSGPGHSRKRNGGLFWEV